MEDVMGKIEKILGDEESMKQVSELAQMFMNGSNDGKNLPDTDSVMKLTGIMSNFTQNDKNTDLINALKPHLKEERQKKADRAVKVLRLISVLNTAKENGLLNDII